MLKLLARPLAKISERLAGRDCNTSFVRSVCEDCLHIDRWMPRVAFFGPANSRMHDIVLAQLEIQQEILDGFCSACFILEDYDYSEDGFGWVDVLECECLCLIARMAGFNCKPCLPVVDECLWDVFVACPSCVNAEEQTFVFYLTTPDTLTYDFLVCDDPAEFRGYFKAFLDSKTSGDTVDDVLRILDYIYPAETITPIDYTFGKAWFSIGRQLTDVERSLANYIASFLPLADGVDFRLLEPPVDAVTPI